MRNHDEILQEAFENNVWPEDTMATFMENDEPLYHVVAQAIRQAQLEAIEECAGIAGKVLKHEHQEPLLDEINDEILQLKNQVK